MEKRRFYDVETMSPVVASLIDRCLCFVERFDLTRMNAFYLEMVIKWLFGHSEVVRTSA